MRTLRFTLITLGFALAAIPASATITYSYCTSSCSSTGGSYAAWQAAPGASGLAFGALTTFVSGGLAGTGIYTDSTTGTLFTNYSSGGSVDTGTHVNSGYLIQGNFGTNTGFEIDVPANTYALAMYVSGCSSTCGSLVFMSATAGLGTHSSYGTPYSLTIPGGGPSQFFGIVSDTPITSIFLASGYNNSYLGLASFEIGEGGGGGSETPEAATFLMIGGGLIALYLCRRRRRPQPPCQVYSPRPIISVMAPAHQ